MTIKEDYIFQNVLKSQLTDFQILFILLLRNQTKVCLEFILKVVLEDLFSNLGYFTKRGHWDDYGLRTFGLTKQGRGQKEEGENR